MKFWKVRHVSAGRELAGRKVSEARGSESEAGEGSKMPECVDRESDMHVKVFQERQLIGNILVTDQYILIVTVQNVSLRRGNLNRKGCSM